VTEPQDASQVQDNATSDESWLRLIGPGELRPLDDYVENIANRGLRKYRGIVQWGKKEGQTYYDHILDGVMTLGRLCQLKPLGITDDEARCLFLAFTVHDINKVEAYGKKAYADVATDENIHAELTSLDASSFFSEWQTYLHDIGELARLHQGHLAVTIDGLDRRKRLLLDEQAEPGRVHRLGYLIQAVDELALSHTLDERASKDKFLFDLNRACATEQYRFVTHRLSEYRGVLTNVIHNCVVAYLRERYSSSLDLLYYSDGVAYLFPKQEPVTWEDDDVVAVAERVKRRLAELQAGELGQFIKGRPFGIAVDAAAIESGASAGDLLGAIYSIVARKRYTEDRGEQREADVRGDLQSALAGGKLAPDIAARIQALLASPAILPSDETGIRCGEYATAYRNLVNDHSVALGLHIIDAWEHLYQALELPTENYPLYNAVNTYRRGFFVARDLPANLRDIDALHDRFLGMLAPEEGERNDDSDEGSAAREDSDSFTRSLTEYLRRTLLVSASSPTCDFSGYLREYVMSRNRQCCNCSTMLPTQDWMTANAPASIGVQTFSNRLEGAALREPKRQICPICRAQFILEKIAWLGHNNKMGLPKTGAGGTKSPGYTTFYLYLYPRSYFTEPFLQAWTREIQRLRDQDTTAFYINLGRAFRSWAAGDVGHIPIIRTKLNGVALPQLPEATRNIPILPINAPGQNYGEQFMVALQKAVLLRSFFGCRVVLSRLPAPPIDAAGLKTLFVDGLPRNLLRLVAGRSSGAALYEHEANLTDEQVTALEQRLQWLHQLQDALYIPGGNRDLVHDLAVALGDDDDEDPLRLYHALDRAIEEKAAATKGGGIRNRGGKPITPEMQATSLSRMVVPLANELVRR
jgi:CRISPR-associated protein Csc3